MANNTRCRDGCQINVTYFKDCGIDAPCKEVEVSGCPKATRLPAGADNTTRTNSVWGGTDETIIPCKKNIRVRKHEVHGNCGDPSHQIW